MEPTSFSDRFKPSPNVFFFDDSKVATPFIKSSARTLFLEKLEQTKLQTDRQIHGQTDRQTDIYKDRQTDGHIKILK
jgi:hypothetical protein